MESIGLLLGIFFITLAILGLIILFVEIREDELGNAFLILITTVFFSCLGVILINSYLHSNVERSIKCSEYRIEEQITYSTDSIVDKTYIIYYKK